MCERWRAWRIYRRLVREHLDAGWRLSEFTVAEFRDRARREARRG